MTLTSIHQRTEVMILIQNLIIAINVPLLKFRFMG